MKSLLENNDCPISQIKEPVLRALMFPKHASPEVFEAAALLASSSGAINAESPCGDAAVNRVVSARRPDLLRILARHGADMNRREACGYTPLMSAAIAGDPKTVQALLDSGADSSLAGLSGETAILFSILGLSAECVALLLKSGACPDFPNSDGATPLGNSIAFGFLTGARLLLSAGASPKLPAACNGSTEPPIFLAARKGRLDFCELLLQFGASAHDRDSFGRTPLMAAAVFGHASCVRLLLPRSDAWALDHSGQTVFDLRHPDVASIFSERLHSETRLSEQQSHARSLAAKAALSPPRSIR